MNYKFKADVLSSEIHLVEAHVEGELSEEEMQEYNELETLYHYKGVELERQRRFLLSLKYKFFLDKFDPREITIWGDYIFEPLNK